MTRFLLEMIFLNSLIQEVGNHFWNEEEIGNKQFREFCIFVLRNSQQ